MAGDTRSEYERAQLCYRTAYHVLPAYAYQGLDKVRSEFAASPDRAAKFFYVLGCAAQEAEPHADDAWAVTGWSGPLNDALDCHVIAYPHFPPPDITGIPDDQLFERLSTTILAPYFTAFVMTKAGQLAHYFVLGQSPDARTTLREVSPEWNANLGPGCDPELHAFLAFLSDKLRAGAAPPEAVAAVRYADAAPRSEGKKRWWQFWK